jgi:cell division protein FtsW (lipid II flippase)
MINISYAYRRCMQDARLILSRRRRSNRAVLAGLLLMAAALLVSSWGLVPDLATTVVAIAGFLIVMYGVHLAWLVFYEREPDGPSS